MREQYQFIMLACLRLLKLGNEQRPEAASEVFRMSAGQRLDRAENNVLRLRVNVNKPQEGSRNLTNNQGYLAVHAYIVTLARLSGVGKTAMICAASRMMAGCVE